MHNRLLHAVTQNHDIGTPLYANPNLTYVNCYNFITQSTFCLTTGCRLFLFSPICGCMHALLHNVVHDPTLSAQTAHHLRFRFTTTPNTKTPFAENTPPSRVCAAALGTAFVVSYSITSCAAQKGPGSISPCPKFRLTAEVARSLCRLRS